MNLAVPYQVQATRRLKVKFQQLKCIILNLTRTARLNFISCTIITLPEDLHTMRDVEYPALLRLPILCNDGEFLSVNVTARSLCLPAPSRKKPPRPLTYW